MSKAGTEKRKYTKKLIQDLTLMDDSLFSVCFSQDDQETRAVVQEIISRLLNRKDLSIESVATQVPNLALHSKPIRMDLLAKDKKGKLINIEVQRSASRFDDRRLALYISYLTLRYIREGEDYPDLRDRFLILICDYDPYGKGESVYQLRKLIADKDLDDGLTCILVNGPKLKEENSESGELLRDFYEKNSSEIKIPGLRKLVISAKNDPEKGDEIMTLTEEIRREARAEGKAEGRAEGKAEGRVEGQIEAQLKIVKHMLSQGYNLQSIATMTGLPYEQLNRLALGDFF